MRTTIFQKASTWNFAFLSSSRQVIFNHTTKYSKQYFQGEPTQGTLRSHSKPHLQDKHPINRYNG
jgi:hypothetical protein